MSLLTPEFKFRNDDLIESATCSFSGAASAGIGEIGAEAFKFIDFLAEAHMQIWQVSVHPLRGSLCQNSCTPEAHRLDFSIHQSGEDFKSPNSNRPSP